MVKKTGNISINLRKLSALTKGVLAVFLAVSLTFYGVDVQGVAMAFAEAADPGEAVGLVEEGGEQSEPELDAAVDDSEPAQIVAESEAEQVADEAGQEGTSGESEPEGAEEGGNSQEAADQGESDEDDPQEVSGQDESGKAGLSTRISESENGDGAAEGEAGETEPTTWRIRLDANGGSLAEGAEAQDAEIESVEDAEPVVLPDLYERAGYAFEGWSTVADLEAWWETHDADADDAPLFAPAGVSLFNLAYSYVVLDDGTVQQVSDQVAAAGYDEEGREVQTCDLRTRVQEGSLTLYAQWSQTEEAGEAGAPAEPADSAELSESADAAETKQPTAEDQPEEEQSAAEDTGGIDPNADLPESAQPVADSPTGINALLADPDAVIDSAAGDAKATAVLDEAERSVQARTALGDSANTLSSSSQKFTLLGGSALTVASDTDDAISSLTLAWDTSDSESIDDGDDSKLTLVPGKTYFEYDPVDDPVSMQASLQFTLAGEGSFQPGAVQITVPAQFVTNRNDSFIGSIAIDLPEEPDASQYYAYRLVTPESGNPYYLITNTRTLDAGTTDTIQLTYSDITPHEVESGAVQDGLQATMAVVTEDGSESTKDSNTLTAVINTLESMGDSYHNGGTVVDVSDAPALVQSALTAVATAAGKQTSEYVLVRWNAYAKAKGNQAFSFTMQHELTGSNNGNTYNTITDASGNVVKPEGAVVLGTNTIAAATGSTSFTKDVMGDKTAADPLTIGYIPTGETCYENVWTAYPTSLFTAGTTYKITNSVTWTVTQADVSDSDSNKTSSVFRAASIDYTPPTTTAFKAPTEWYHISGDTLEPHAYSTSDNVALSELAAGADATVGFTVTASGEIMNSTRAADDNTPAIDIESAINNGSKSIEDYYHKRYVTVEAADDALYFHRSYTSELASDDYYVSQVDIRDPYVYTYAVTDEDSASWDFVRTTSGQLPDMALYGLSESEGGTATAWTRLATVSYSPANARQLNPAAYGVSTDNGMVVLDESLGITRVKLVASTKDYDKIEISFNPYITLRASGSRIQELITNLFASSSTPTAIIRNDTTLLAYSGDAVNETEGQEPSVSPENARMSELPVVDIIALTRAYTPSSETKRTASLDDIRYGTDMEHGRSYAYLQGVEPRIGVTSSNTLTYDSANYLDKDAMQASLHYSAAVHEQSNIVSKEAYESYASAGTIAQETSGTWYDLLPVGVEPVLSSIELRSADMVEDAYTVENYRGSGRTLLVVKAKLVPVLKYGSSSDYWSRGYYDEPQINFDAVYNYADYQADNAGYDQLVNVIAFESGNDALGSQNEMIGEPDDATLTNRTEYNNSETAAAVSGVEDLMSDLDSSLTEKKPTFVYARSADSLSIDRTVSSASKTVASDAEGVYRSGTGENAKQVNVQEGQGYTYRISAGSSSSSGSIVVYDVLESHVLDYTEYDYGIGEHSWKGTLVSVDTSELQDAGVAPEVYYSTTVTSSNVETCTIDDSSCWSTIAPDDLSTVTAIAVDCRTSSAGDPFTLEAGAYLPIYIHMTAPVQTESTPLFNTVNSGSEDDPENNSHAFNKAYIQSSSGSSYTNYTKVGILPYKVEVSKLWDDDDNRDAKRPESVTVNLYANGSAATHSDGSAVEPVELGSAHDGESGYSDGGWTYAYENVPSADDSGDAIRYTVVEDAVTDPGDSSVRLYAPSYLRTDDTHLQITNKYTPATVDVSGTVTWADYDDLAGARPSTLVIRLYANGVYKDSKRIAASSDGSWSYSFADLPANEDGSQIAYTVKEEAVDYYATEYAASLAGSGSTVAADGTIQGSTDITNTYAATGFLAIEKTVEGANDASEDESFEFVVELFDPILKVDGESNVPQILTGSYPYHVVDAAGNEVSGSGGVVSTGGAIHLTAGQRAVIEGIPANSTYAVTEQAKDGFTLSASENTSGTVTAAPTEDYAVAARFTNTYSSAGSYQLQATKAFTGKKLAYNQFQFQAYQVFNEGVSGNGDPSLNEREELVGTARNLAGSALDENSQSVADILFPRVNVTGDDLGADGTLTRLYRIREVIPSGATDNGDGTYSYNGITYATNVEQVRVTLVDDGKGAITATQAGEVVIDGSYTYGGAAYTAASAFTSNGDATFSNAYTAAGSFTPVVYKSLIGRDLADNEFSFTLTPLTPGAPVAGDVMTATNKADGSVNFPEIELSLENAGNSYIYAVAEEAGTDGGVIYNTENTYLRVDVTDDGAGVATGAIAVVVPKEGADEAKVIVGDPSVFEATGSSPTITNTLQPGSLSIGKVLADGAVDPAGEGTDFTFKVRLIGSNVAASYTYYVGETETTADVTDGVLEVTLKGGQTATIDNIAAGTAYQVFEESASGWQLSGQSGASGTIGAGSPSVATFTNALAAETATTHLYASKTLDGEAPSNAFGFTLTGATDVPMPASATENSATASNDSAGLVDFGPIAYTQAGTYTYTMREVVPNAATNGAGTTWADADDSTRAAGGFTYEGVTYDNSEWTATVTVTDTDDTDGVALSAAVRYQKGADAATASDVAPVFANESNPGTLTVTNEGVHITTVNAQDFNFTVELVKDGEAVSISSYDKAGSATSLSASTTGVYEFTLMPGQTATFSELPAGTTYTVYETSQPSGWTQTATTSTRGTVPAGGAAAASVTNTYAATGSIALQATKTMQSGSLAAGQFSFQLLGASDGVSQMVSNLAPTSDAAVGKVLFDQIDYDVAGLFADNTDDGVDNPTYAEKVYAYTMQEVVPDAATNSSDMAWSEASDEVKNEGGFSHDGVIYGSDSSSDTLIQTVYVKVADAGDGTLAVTRVQEDESLAMDTPNFTNNYETGKLKVTATALGTNEATADVEFRFLIELKDASGRPIGGSYPIEYRNAAGEKFSVYNDNGDNGEITQVIFSNDGMTEGVTNAKSGECFIISGLPAGATYEVWKMSSEATTGFTYVAETNVAGTIVAGEEPIVASFTSVYAAEGSISLHAQATIDDADEALSNVDIADFTFTFQLYDENNNLLQTKKSDSTGLVTFDAIGFTALQAGTEESPNVYRYKIVEVNDTQKNVQYDTHIGWVNVSVYDNGADSVAQLTVTATYEHPSSAADTTPETFNNIYLISTEFPSTGGSGLAIPVALALILAAAVAALRMRRWRQRG